MLGTGGPDGPVDLILIAVPVVAANQGYVAQPVPDHCLMYLPCTGRPRHTHSAAGPVVTSDYHGNILAAFGADDLGVVPEEGRSEVVGGEPVFVGDALTFAVSVGLGPEPARCGDPVALVEGFGGVLG